MATDIVTAVAMSLTHSQIDTVQFQWSLFPHLQCWEVGDLPLEADAHGAIRLTVADTVRQRKVRGDLCPLWVVVSTGRRNTLSWSEKMECDDGSGLSSRVYGS